MKIRDVDAFPVTNAIPAVAIYLSAVATLRRASGSYGAVAFGYVE